MHPGSPAIPQVSDQDDREPWLVADGLSLRSRLILGIEQYRSAELVGAVLQAGECDVFITTFDLTNTRSSLLLADLDDQIPLGRFAWIGTTSFARSEAEALKTARALRDAFGITVMKLDVRPEDNAPHNEQTVSAAKELLADGFTVLPFIRPDVATALELQDAGCPAIRVMTAPVGSRLGIVDPDGLSAIIEATHVPVIIEGGLSSPEHVRTGMELGAQAALVNTAVASAASPVAMATSMRQAVEEGFRTYASKTQSLDPA